MRRNVLRVASIVLVAVGVAMMAWPIATQWRAAVEASRGIASATAVYDDMDEPERAAVRDEARRYNRLLASGGDLSTCAPYAEQLSFDGSEMIAYISIPSIAVQLPIYHGTEDKALMAGVGHLAESSLPVGGASSHCVLTAHTGAPGMRMFDDIDLLVPGDVFVLHVMGEDLAYRVTGSQVVLPNETDSLRIVSGQDLCTLVTCTPYGVNTHRLLVHAERCALDAGPDGTGGVGGSGASGEPDGVGGIGGPTTPDGAGAPGVGFGALYVNRRTAPYLIGILLLSAFALILLIRR